jgi:hypothetical protein
MYIEGEEGLPSYFFSKLVILVNTGQLVENNTTYARDTCDFLR